MIDKKTLVRAAILGYNNTTKVVWETGDIRYLTSIGYHIIDWIDVYYEDMVK